MFMKVQGGYYNQKKAKVLIVLDDMKTDMEAKNKLTSIVTALFLRVTKINVLLVFMSRSYFKVAKTISLNATHFLL